MVISIKGNLTGRLLTEFETHARNASESGMHVVLDMAQSGYFGPNTLGSLVQLMTSMQRLNLQLWLAQMRPHLIRLLRSSRLDSYFKTTSSVNDALYRIAKSERGLQTSAIPELRWKTASPVQMRVEVMQSICQTMAVGSQNMHLGFGSGFTPHRDTASRSPFSETSDTKAGLLPRRR